MHTFEKRQDWDILAETPAFVSKTPDSCVSGAGMNLFDILKKKFSKQFGRKSNGFFLKMEKYIFY